MIRERGYPLTLSRSRVLQRVVTGLFVLYSVRRPTVALQYSVILTSGSPCALSDFRSRARPSNNAPRYLQTSDSV